MDKKEKKMKTRSQTLAKLWGFISNNRLSSAAQRIRKHEADNKIAR